MKNKKNLILIVISIVLVVIALILVLTRQSGTMSKKEKSFINSSMIMDLHAHGVDVKDLVPESVYKRLK